ncbi:MAG TPA: class I SAM-dependent methyltransferase [Coriobacteriia bacterium]
MPKPPEYDVFVNWEKRLAREAPFYRAVFEQIGAKTVADVGAGSARMSLMFAGWGLTVYAIDPDPGMLEQARKNAAEAGIDLPIYAGAFGDVADVVPGRVDALVCSGNALPHVGGLRELKRAFADFAEVVRPGGAVVLHLLNHQRLLDQRVRTVPPVVRETPQGTLVFLRLLDYDEPGGIGFDFLTMLRRPDGEWEIANRRRSVHTALPAYVLVDELDHAGFTRISLFGDHERKPFEAEKDESVIVLAYRAD